ncbi:hypothetical protein ACJIZ3_023906 [Penstemon smallii]|uniref:Bromo domain-containing protein n=1 Tax=Penstemon smallii TaxID=265156 RepID=A0ABD3TQI5_9LAMI
MKRKRGNKKGRAKKPKLVATNEVTSNVVSLHTEDNSGVDEFDNEEVNSEMDAETEITPTPSEPTLPEKPSTNNIVGRPIDNVFGRAVYTRVKVRLKTSNNLEAQLTSSDAPAQSDTDKSSQQGVSEKQGVPNEKMEDSTNSPSETNGCVSGNTSKKSMGIKIKSSRGFGSSSMSPCNNIEPCKGDKKEKQDAGLLHQDSRYDEQELKLALEVIRKVMKMDAAGPFNVPVNPVALGIPDYHDVIHTPMDFGTICSNLEKGVRYMNSEDVLKDVQYIWDNCYKYNKKGDYIVDLMERVKKKFTKYWTAVCLFNNQSQEISGVESNAVKDGTPSSQGTATPVDSGALSLKKFHGLKKHKEGCQCAICVMMRRRQERDEIARMMRGPSEDSDDSLGEDIKLEGISHGGSPFGEYASPNPDTDVDMERKGQELKLGHIRNFYGQQRENDMAVVRRGDGFQDLHLNQRSGDENSRQYEAPHIRSGVSISNDDRKEMRMQNEDGGGANDQQKPKEKLDKNQRAKMLENLRYLDNPMLLDLYGTLFADNSKSFWNGSHSLAGYQGANRRSSLHSAISTFMR